MINIKQELEVAKRASEIAAALLIDNKDNINKILSNEGRDVKLKADLESEKVIKEYLLENSNFPILAEESGACLLYTSPSPRDLSTSRMPSSA